MSRSREAVAFWGDSLTALMMEARPGTSWFQEVGAAVKRAGLNGVDARLAGADVAGVCADLDIPPEHLGDYLGVPDSVGYALAEGWVRPSTAGLFTLAAALEVPVAAFVRDHEFEPRQRTLIFEDFLAQVRAGRNPFR